MLFVVGSYLFYGSLLDLLRQPRNNFGRNHTYRGTAAQQGLNLARPNLSAADNQTSSILNLKIYGVVMHKQIRRIKQTY
jgi:hypothetical protein